MNKFVMMLMVGLLALGSAYASEKYEKAAGESVKVKTEAKSQAINEITYDAESKVLTLIFIRGTYQYADVPAEVHQALVDSESQGVYYRENIKGKYKSTKIKK